MIKWSLFLVCNIDLILKNHCTSPLLQGNQELSCIITSIESKKYLTEYNAFIIKNSQETKHKGEFPQLDKEY